MNPNPSTNPDDWGTEREYDNPSTNPDNWGKESDRTREHATEDEENERERFDLREGRVPGE